MYKRPKTDNNTISQWANIKRNDNERIWLSMKMNFKNGKLPGKSTAAVICFCLAAVAALGIFSYNRSANELKSELSGISGTASETTAETEPESEEADAPAEVPFTEADAPQENIKLEHDGLSGDGSEVIMNAEADASDQLNDAVVRPVNGEIICDFSDGELVKSRTLNVWKTHNGIDVAAEEGTDVKSMTSGTVTEILSDPLMGVTVIIDHGSGFEGYYSNLSADVNVKEGEAVSAGTSIGTVGNTAEAEIAEESHLHFGLKKNGSWTDPAELLSSEGS